MLKTHRTFKPIYSLALFLCMIFSALSLGSVFSHNKLMIINNTDSSLTLNVWYIDPNNRIEEQPAHISAHGSGFLWVNQGVLAVAKDGLNVNFYQNDSLALYLNLKPFGGSTFTFTERSIGPTYAYSWNKTHGSEITVSLCTSAHYSEHGLLNHK